MLESLFKFVLEFEKILKIRGKCVMLKVYIIRQRKLNLVMEESVSEDIYSRL